METYTNDDIKNKIKQILTEINFKEFIQTNLFENGTIYKLNQYLLICGELNNEVYNSSISEEFLIEHLKLKKNQCAQYINICNEFRTKFKKLNIIAKVDGPVILFETK